MVNILILDGGKHQYINLIKPSKYVKKIYVVSDKELEGAINISFNTFKELAQKCKSLQIDMVLVENEKWILQGVADVLRKNFVNCIAPTSNWTKIALDKKYGKNLAEKYDIITPRTIILPNQYPMVVKSNKDSRIGNSISEIISIREEFSKYSPEITNSIFLEEYISGIEETLISLYDGKNLLTFPSKDIPQQTITEYNDKLNNLFAKENADFIGFIGSNVIYDGKKIYNIGFTFDIELPDSEIVYPVILAIYQKLDDVNRFTLNQI